MRKVLDLTDRAIFQLGFSVLTWEGRLLKGGDGLRHAFACNVDVPPASVLFNLRHAAGCNCRMLIVEILLELDQVAEVLLRQESRVDVARSIGSTSTISTTTAPITTASSIPTASSISTTTTTTIPARCSKHKQVIRG
jgi:hypothetical protein